MNHTPNIISFRTAFFFTHDIERPDQLFWTLTKDIPEFDSMPSVQPLPPGIKSNGIPLITFRSANNVFSCEISQSRMDFVIRLADHFGQYSPDAIFEAYLRISNVIASYVSKIPSVNILRVGLVGEFFSPNLNPVALIQKVKQLPEEKDLLELAIRSNKRTVIGNLECNDIQTLEALDILQRNTVQKGVLFSRDVNNNPQQGIVLELAQMQSLINEGSQLLHKCSFEELMRCEA